MLENLKNASIFVSLRKIHFIFYNTIKINKNIFINIYIIIDILIQTIFNFHLTLKFIP